MNEYDTQVASGLLEQAGFKVVDGNGTTSEAIDAPLPVDIYLMNTCSVREHAEDRVYGRLGALGKIKKSNPNLMIGLMGCMVEEHKEKLFKRFPQLDLMVGTRNIKELPALIEEVRQSRKQAARIKQDGISIEYTEQIKRNSPYHAWLPIMTGCDKVCTYCIVPITRGSEVSMPAREVYREASRLVEEGVQWITLLGQNVNSYNGHSNANLLPPSWGKV
ncbi:MAG: radical SAM protein, partial [Candidatus Omnitrophica bacterium]|nr:radical SAM protein [Candidatus Omnitrophota bacterium]